MSDRVGLVTYHSDNPIFLGRDMGAHNSYSDATASVIDEEVHKLIEDAHSRAVKLLTENRSILDNMARLLIERETIYTDEVDMLMAGDSLEKIREHMDSKEESAKENPFRRYDAKLEKEIKEVEKAEKESEKDKVDDTKDKE